jgi:hypothetical protein
LRLSESNQKLTEMVQAASIETECDLVTQFDALERQPASQPRKLVFSWSVDNVGHTPANQVQSLRVVNLAGTLGSGELTPPNHFTIHMAPGQKNRLPFAITLSPAQWKLLRQQQSKAWIEINGQIKYKDVFGKPHESDWLFRIYGDGTPEYRQFSAVQNITQ